MVRYVALAVAAILGSTVVAVLSAAIASDATPGAVPPTLNDLALRVPTEFGSTEGDDLRGWLVRDAPAEVRAGAAAYADNCAVCHGDTGLGYDEAKLSFPTDHRTCTRCHRPGNEREMSFATMMERQHDLFDVGDPPALRGAGALASFPSDEALFAYTRATMPRYQPGRMTDDAYGAVVAFLRWIQAEGGAFDGLDAERTDAGGS